MKLAWTGAALVAMASAGLLEKSAVAADVPIAVLGIEATEAPDALAASITEALRQRVTATKGFRLVPGRDLVEVKLVFSCPDEAPSCMAQAGKSLGASKLIFGSVKKSVGDTFLVTLKLLDANRGIVDAFQAEQITKAQSTGAAIRGPVQKWFNTLTGQGGGAGVVKVRSDVIGAAVALDGNPAGVMGTDDLVLPGITPGKHEVVITKSGYEPARREITVTSGDTAPVDIKMVRSPSAAPPVVTAPVTGSRTMEPPPPATETGPSLTPLKIATWGVFLGGLGGVVLGVKFGTDVQSINNDLDEYRRFQCAQPPYMLCDAKGKMARPLNKAEVDYVKAKKDDGQRLELYQYVSYGVGGALLITSGYLFYRAYVAEPEARASKGRTLAWAPILSPTTAGAAAVMHF
jgi:hypothetical protein